MDFLIPAVLVANFITIVLFGYHSSHGYQPVGTKCIAAAVASLPNIASMAVIYYLYYMR